MVAGYDNQLCSWLLVVFITIITTMAPTASVLAEEVPAPKPAFYETAKEGWFWYHDPLPKMPEELAAKSTITREAGPKVFETKNPTMDKYTINDIWNLSGIYIRMNFKGC